MVTSTTPLQFNPSALAKALLSNKEISKSIGGHKNALEFIAKSQGFASYAAMSSSLAVVQKQIKEKVILVDALIFDAEDDTFEGVSSTKCRVDLSTMKVLNGSDFFDFSYCSTNKVVFAKIPDGKSFRLCELIFKNTIYPDALCEGTDVFAIGTIEDFKKAASTLIHLFSSAIEILLDKEFVVHNFIFKDWEKKLQKEQPEFLTKKYPADHDFSTLGSHFADQGFWNINLDEMDDLHADAHYYENEGGPEGNSWRYEYESYFSLFSLLYMKKEGDSWFVPDGENMNLTFLSVI